MAIALRSSTFRAGAVVLGLVGLSATALFYSVFVVSVGTGLIFGAGGWLLDWYTDFRRLSGQLSSWALAAGGAVVALDWRNSFVPFDARSLSPWPSTIQYVAVVLLCWGILMFVMPRISDDLRS
jgi:hypothetical protein